MELRVGQRVKVVAPDPNDGGSAYVGVTGVIRGRWRRNDYGYEWSVDLDGDYPNDVPFTPQELAPLDVTMFEGVIDDTRMGEDYPGVWVDTAKVDDELAKFAGKRIRITIEVLDS